MDTVAQVRNNSGRPDKESILKVLKNYHTTNIGLQDVEEGMQLLTDILKIEHSDKESGVKRSLKVLTTTC